MLILVFSILSPTQLDAPLDYHLLYRVIRILRITVVHYHHLFGCGPRPAYELRLASPRAPFFLCRWVSSTCLVWPVNPLIETDALR